MQLENTWLHISGGVSGGIDTEGKISMLEFVEQRTTPGRYSTIGHLTLSDTVQTNLAASSLAAYGDKGLKEHLFYILHQYERRN